MDREKVDTRPNPPRMERVWRIQNGDEGVNLNRADMEAGMDLGPHPPLPRPTR